MLLSGVIPAFTLAGRQLQAIEVLKTPGGPDASQSLWSRIGKGFGAVLTFLTQIWIAVTHLPGVSASLASGNSLDVEASAVSAVAYRKPAPAVVSPAATLSGATIVNHASSLTLPTGAIWYVFGFATGGANGASAFATGSYGTVTNAHGYITAGLAATASASDSYTASTVNYDIGGVALSGYSGYMSWYNTNGAAGASGVSVSFNVQSSGSTVLVFGLAGGEECLSLGGIPGLTTLVSTTQQYPMAFTIASTTLSAGPYTVSETTSACGTTDPSTNGDLIGVFVLGPQPPHITSVSTITAATSQTITISGSGFGSSPTTYTLPDGSVDTTSCNVVTPALIITDGGSGADSWSAGHKTCGNTDSIGVFITSWSDTQIVLSGFGTEYLGVNGQNNYNIAVGDPITVGVFGPNNDGEGTYQTVVQSTTASVTFNLPSGLVSGASGNAVVVDGITHTVSQLPLPFTWNIGSPHSFSWLSVINSGNAIENTWSSTSGCSQSSQSGTITVPSGGCTVGATYAPKYQITYKVDPSGEGTVTWSGGGNGPGSTTTSDSTNFYFAGSSITLGYENSMSGYAFWSWTPSGGVSITGSTATVSGVGTITGSFPTTSCPISQIPTGSDTVTLFWITDTQYLSDHATSNSNLFATTTQWVARYYTSCNGHMVVHTGDIVQGNSSTELTSMNGKLQTMEATEWSNANAAMSVLMSANIPYTWDAGNHDGYDATKGYESDNPLDNGWYPAVNPPLYPAFSQSLSWLVSSYDNGMSTAVTFSAPNPSGGSPIDFLIINIAYAGGESYANTIKWVNTLLNEYPTYDVIIATHAYVDPTYGNCAPTATNSSPCDGNVSSNTLLSFLSELDGIANSNSNVFLTLNGHFDESPYRYETQSPVNGHLQLMFDRQELGPCGHDCATGAASVTTLTFDLTNKALYVNTFDATQPPPSPIQGFWPSPSLPLNLPTRTPPSISASPTTVDSGQSSLLTTISPFSGGSSPYTCQWLEESPGAGVYSDLGSSFSCNTSSLPNRPTGALLPTGMWKFELQATDATNTAIDSPPVSVTVYPDPTVSVSPIGPFIYDVRQSASALITMVTYSGPNADPVEWYRSSTSSCSSSSSDTGVSGNSFTPDTSSASTSWYCAVVSDSGLPGYYSASNAVEVTVYPDPTVSVTPSGPISYDLNQAASALTAGVTYSGPNADPVEWYSSTTSACSQSSADTGTSGDSFAPGTSFTGTNFYCTVITDSGVYGYSYASNAVEVTVYPDPTVSVSPVGPLDYDVGQSASTLTATVSYLGQNAHPVDWYSSTTSACSSASTDMKVSGTAFTPSTASAGTTYYCAVVFDGGVSGYSSASNAVEVTTTKAITSIATTLSSQTIVVGGSTTDSAKLTGATSNAGGKVTYEYFPSGTCTGTATVVGSPVTVTNGVVPNSISKTFNSAGPYGWKAIYSGDSSNLGATSGCEPLTVMATPKITTTLSHAGIYVGQSIYDSALLTSNFKAGGTVTYEYFSGGACSGTPVKVGKPVMVTNGVVPNSVSQVFSSVGAYSWKALYSGDNYNKAATSPCELLSVLPTTMPATHTTITCTKLSLAVGTRVTCTATVTGGYLPHTGTITWSKVSGTAGVTFSSKTCTLVSGRCSVTLTATVSGSITIRATYIGDSHNPWSYGTRVLTIT
jgi:hypothetical protein